MRARSLAEGLGLAALIVVADQATKAWALATLFDPPVAIEVTGFLNLVPVWNTGVSFGILAGGPAWTGLVLTLFAVAVAIALAVWLARAPAPLVRAALGLIIGGALGNAIDRVLHGAVVDFVDVHAAGYHWPAFNIADSAITLGVILMILDAIVGTDGQSGGGRKEEP